MMTEGEHPLWSVCIQLQYLYCLLHYFGYHSYCFNNLFFLFFPFKENGEILHSPQLLFFGHWMVVLRVFALVISLISLATENCDQRLAL